MTAKSGSGPLAFDMAAGSVLLGDAILTSGTGNDTYSIAGSILGSLTVNTGDGVNTFAFSGNVGVSVNLTEGNGPNGATTFSGSVGYNLTIIQGNGANAVGGVTVSGSVGGLLSYTGGNGTDALSIIPGSAAYYNINVSFGTNTAANAYSLTFNANDMLSGSIQSKSGDYTFNEDSAYLMPSLGFP